MKELEYFSWLLRHCVHGGQLHAFGARRLHSHTPKLGEIIERSSREISKLRLSRLCRCKFMTKKLLYEISFCSLILISKCVLELIALQSFKAKPNSASVSNANCVVVHFGELSMPFASCFIQFISASSAVKTIMHLLIVKQ